MMEESRILICGDLCPTDDNRNLFDSCNIDLLFGDIISDFENCDLIVGNLEAPLTDAGEAIVKCGPLLKGKASYGRVFKEAGFGLLSLANNHIRDFGDSGIQTTLEQCGKLGIGTVGGGTLEQARKPYYVDTKGWKIGFLSFAEHEFNIATRHDLGANLFDPYSSFDDISEAKGKCDYLVVLYHGGIEYYPYASPFLQKKCRKMVEKGADLVLCQHSHCIGADEDYLHGRILYGQGNTLFGYKQGNNGWNEGLVVEVKLSGNGKEVSYIPVCAKKGGGITKIAETERTRVLTNMANRSKALSNPDDLQKQWDLFTKSKEAEYLPMFLGWGRYLNKLNRIFKNLPIRFLYNRKKFRTAGNIIRCDSHNEVLSGLLKKIS